METIRIGGKRYSDPDVLSLIRSTGELVDPRSAVVSQARLLNAHYKDWGGSAADPFQRLKILASLRGFDVLPMQDSEGKARRRDAVIVPSADPRNHKGQIFFIRQSSQGRINFSIAHEIAHTFFTNTLGGARFRSICESDSREANELERLCDYAASEILMPIEDFRASVEKFSISSVKAAADFFGSSVQATIFRMATAHPGIAAAGLLRYRLKLPEQRQVEAWRAARAKQKTLFTEANDSPPEFQRKYRLQSFLTSESFDGKFTVRWNKSFSEQSCIYKAASSDQIASGREPLPSVGCPEGLIEAIRAPYQTEETDEEYPDILFLWTANES